MWILWLLLICTDAFAEPTLPYMQRTQPYNGFSTTARGDIRTVGMAGATVGLADTFIAATDNPAGLAMTMGTGDFNFTSNWVNDNRPQDYEYSINTTNFGAALNAYPWGLAAGYVSPYSESQPYLLPSSPTPSDPVLLTARIREMRFSAARIFAKNRFSLGATLILGQAETEYSPLNDPESSTAHHSYSVGATLGAMVQLENRFLLGLSYSPPQRYGGEIDKTVPGISGFFQPVHVPDKLGLGLGWIPNRFFRSDISLFVIGRTEETALLRNDTSAVGRIVTFQPHLGAAYLIADYRDFSATLFLGTYAEMMRIEGAAHRVHLTGGIETKPWILTVGWGLDLSPGYNNALVTFGVDVFKVMAKLDLIPTPWRPAHAGFHPSMLGMSDEGLPRPLVKNWRPQGPPIDPIRIGLGLPGKIGDKVLEVGDTVKTFTEEMIGIDEPKPNIKPAAPPRQTRPQKKQPKPSPKPSRAR